MERRIDVRRAVSRAGCIAAVAVAVSALPAAAQAPPPASAALVKALVSALGTSGLDAIAARDPQAPDRAIAALAFPGSQLLVVAGPFPDPKSLDAYLANHMYRDVYSLLQQPSITAGKVFFQDLGCDGLTSGPDGSVDIMYEDGTKQTVFDGEWKKQKLSQAAYQQRMKDADTRYAQLLTALVTAAQAAPKTVSK